MSNVLPFTRRPLRTGVQLGPRATTENVKRLPKRELEAGRVHLRLLEAEGIDVRRPATRGDCIGGERPCPWVSCKHNLYLDVHENGSIKTNFPDLEPDQVPPEKSCALDVADRGGATLDDVATTMNITRERVRQIELMGIELLRQRSGRKNTDAAKLREFVDGELGAVRSSKVPSEGSVFNDPAVGAVREEEDESAEEEVPARISFFAEDPQADEAVCSNVWRMFTRDSNSRGFAVAPVSVQARARAFQEASTGLPEGHIEERKIAMAEQKKRGEMLERVADVQRAFAAKNGREATTREVFDALGADYAISVQNVRMAMKRLAAREINGAGSSAKAIIVAREAPRPEPVRRAPRAKAVLAVVPQKATGGGTPSPTTTSNDPFVATLIAKRDELVAKAAALTTTIETFAVGL